MTLLPSRHLAARLPCRHLLPLYLCRASRLIPGENASRSHLALTRWAMQSISRPSRQPRPVPPAKPTLLAHLRPERPTCPRADVAPVYRLAEMGVDIPALARRMQKSEGGSPAPSPPGWPADAPTRACRLALVALVGPALLGPVMAARANGVPQLVKLTYIEGISNWGLKDAEGSSSLACRGLRPYRCEEPPGPCGLHV